MPHESAGQDPFDWMENATIELSAEPLAYPDSTETETVRTHVKQIIPKEIDGNHRFFTYEPREPIVMAIRRYDADLKKHVHDWQAHTLSGTSQDRFHPDGPFFSDIPHRNEAKLRPAIYARKVPGFVFFADEHGDENDRFKNGDADRVHPTFADALGYLRSEARIGFKKQYREAFRELDRDAANLLALVYNAMRFTIYDEPNDLSDKLVQVTSSWNLQELVGRERAGYWQKATAESLRLKSGDISAAEGEGTTARFSRELSRFKSDLAEIHVKHPFNYASEAKVPDLTTHLKRAYDLLMPLFEITHPSSSIVSSLLYNPTGETTETGKNLRQCHATVRALIRYFGNDVADNTLINDYRQYWGEFEDQAAALTIPEFIDAGSWKPLYQRGKTLTISVKDLEATLHAAEAKGYEKLVGPIALGPGRYARFKDNDGYHVGLWTPHKAK